MSEMKTSVTFKPRISVNRLSNNRALTYKIHIGSHERWWQVVPVPLRYILINILYFLISMLDIEHINVYLFTLQFPCASKLPPL